MRHWIIALACVALLPTVSLSQEKILPSISRTAPDRDSFCDGIPQNSLFNCGFEYANFGRWELGGATDFVGVANDAAYSGNYGAYFGAVGDVTTLTYSVPTVPGQRFTLWFYLANPRGGFGTDFEVDWDGEDLDDFVDAERFDYQVFIFQPLDANPTSDYTLLTFKFRHDPDFWLLDDVIVAIY